MPGEYIQDVHIYKCGTNSDGTAIMCSEIGWAKVQIGTLEPFSSDDPARIGWQDPGQNDVYIPLTSMIRSLEQLGLKVSYDPDDLEQRLGPHPT